MSKDIKKWSYETEIKYLDSENKRLINKNNKCIRTIIDLYNEKVKLIDENEKLKDELKEANSDVGIFIEENTELQNELFTKELIQYETEDYINSLKQELFNLYLKHYN